MKSSTRASTLIPLGLIALTHLPVKVAAETPFCEKKLRSVQAKILSIADGDTIRVQIPTESKSTPVRFKSIDTPERRYVVEGRGALNQGPWADRAAESLHTLVSIGSNVTLKFSPFEMCDSFGRALAEVYSGKTNLNLKQVERGVADPYCLNQSLKECLTYAKASRKAWEQKIGMWGDPDRPLPAYEWRRQVSGRKFELWTMNVFNKKVYRPADLQKVPIFARAFFFEEQ